MNSRRVGHFNTSSWPPFPAMAWEHLSELPADPPPAPAPRPAFSGYGIEIEYMIVKDGTLDVLPLADALLQGADGSHTGHIQRGEMGWSNEPARHVVEIKNMRPHPTLKALSRAFQWEVRAINARLEASGARLMPGGMHPWMNPREETRFWPYEPAAGLYQTYHRIFDCQRHGWANLQSMHLNLPFANDAEFARLHAAIRLVLPILPALAASSPYADGVATGFMDYRLECYRTHQEIIPSSQGNLIPDESPSRIAYEAEVLAPMYRQLGEHDPEGLLRHEWFNARAAIPRFDRNAIEIRILDTQECPMADIAIAAVTTALIERIYRSEHFHSGLFDTTSLVRILNACVADADQALISDRHYLMMLGVLPRPCLAGDLWTRLIEDLASEGYLAAIWLPPLRHIQRHGPLARRLMDSLGKTPSPKRLQTVYEKLCQCLRDGRMFGG